MTEPFSGNGVMDLLLILIPLGPLLGGLLDQFWKDLIGDDAETTADTISPWCRPLLVGCLISLLGVVGLFMTMALTGNWPGPVRLSHPIVVGGEAPLQVSLNVQVDRLSAVVLGVVLACALAAVIHLATTGLLRGGSPFAVGLLVSATTMMPLTADFLLLLFFWELSAVAASWMLGYRAGGSARKCFLIGRLCDVGLLWGLLFLWSTFGTLEFSEVLNRPAAIADALHNNRAAVGVMSLGLLAGVIGRCGQFPLFGYWADIGESPPAVVALVLPATLVPSGLYGMLRCSPLWAASPETSWILASVGGLTGVLAGLTALAVCDLKQVLGYCLAAEAGLVLLGLGSGRGPGLSGAVSLMAVSSLVLTALLLTVVRGEHQERRKDRTVFLVGGLFLASGVGGSHAILASLWTAEMGTAGLSRVLAAFALLSVLLVALALGRAFFLTFGAGRSVSKEHKEIGLASSAGLTQPARIRWDRVAQRWLLPAFVVPVAWLFPLGWRLGGGILLILPGLIAVWMLYGKPSPMPQRLALMLGGVPRLFRHRFYLEECFHFGVVLPVRGMAHLGRFLDRLLLDTVIAGWPAHGARWLVRAVRPLQTGVTAWYALSVMLAMGVLLVVLIWLRAGTSL